MGASRAATPIGSAGNSSPISATVRLAIDQVARAGDGAGLGLVAGVAEHGAGEDVLGLGMGRHAEAGDVDADDADAVDLLRQQVERHAGGGRDAEVDDDDGVVVLGLGGLVHRLADVLEELAGDEGFRIEGHVADGALGAVEVAGEGQAIDAAGAAREDGRGAAHAQPDPQRAEGRAHGSAAGRAGRAGSPPACGPPAPTCPRCGRRPAWSRGRRGRRGLRSPWLSCPRRRLRGRASRRWRCRTCLPWWRGSAPRRGRPHRP